MTMKNSSIAKLHRDYPDRQLLEKTATRDPFRLFHHWFRQAVQARLIDPNAMAVTTVSPSGKPSARMVLLRGLDKKGFVFFTNYLSQKGKELKKRPHASLLFFWPLLGRQVRVEGRVERVTARESDAYFATRPRGSQLSAWVSKQSERIPNRESLEKRMVEFEVKFKNKKIPRPSHWGGYRVLPVSIEYWSGRRNRLHDRLRYQRKSKGGWRRERLAP
jgi:pyridoxamine 5'-phosphate oxidase